MINHITRTYAEDIIARHDLKARAPKNYALLKKNFELIRVADWNKTISAELKSKTLPGSCLITATFNIDDDEQVKNLLLFANDTLRNFFKSNNYLIRALNSSKGSTIHFVYSSDKSLNLNSTTNAFVWRGLAKKHPYLKLKTPTLWFYIKSTGNTEKLSLFEKWKWGDTWFLLPDNKLVLVEYFGDTVLGVGPGILKTEGLGFKKETLLVFSADGKLVYKEE